MQNCGTAQLITAHFVTHFRASLTTATTMSLMGVAFPTNSLLHWIAPSNEHFLSAVLKRHRSREGPSHCGGVLVGCQGEELSVTSACDIGAVCHVGLFLLHAVMAKGWPSSSLPTLSNRLTHAPGSFVPFRRSVRSTTVEIRRVFYTPPGVGCQNGHDTANWTKTTSREDRPRLCMIPLRSRSRSSELTFLSLKSAQVTKQRRTWAPSNNLDREPPVTAVVLTQLRG